MRLILVTLLFSPLAFAADIDDVNSCLANWKNHPFGNGKPDFRVISSKVRVVGIGGELTDAKETEKPELVLIKPAVSVMSKTTMRLLNSNGWYCLKGKVDVMAKSEIELDCKAHMTSSTSGATVLGTDDNETGVTVLGKSTVTRVGCKKE